MRARVGDRIKFSMTNRSDEPVPGVQLTAAPMMHSMDFHSAMVSPQDKYRSIAPGPDDQLRVHARTTRACSCTTAARRWCSSTSPRACTAMMVVEPREGYPTKVDREYAVIQSEFYTKPDPGRSARSTARRSTCSTATACAPRRPTYTVFNGRYNGMVDKPLPAKPGERVRLFVLNVGPSNTSSFHVVGTIFDRVWIDGNPDNQMRGMQTVLLGSSSGAIVEFIIPEAGNYVMVDHHFANASQGAIGLDRPPAASRPKGSRASSTTTSRPPRRRPTPEAVTRQARVRDRSASPATRSPAATSSGPTCTR